MEPRHEALEVGHGLAETRIGCSREDEVVDAAVFLEHHEQGFPGHAIEGEADVGTQRLAAIQGHQTLLDDTTAGGADEQVRRQGLQGDVVAWVTTGIGVDGGAEAWRVEGDVRGGAGDAERLPCGGEGGDLVAGFLSDEGAPVESGASTSSKGREPRGEDDAGAEAMHGCTCSSPMGGSHVPREHRRIEAISPGCYTASVFGGGRGGSMGRPPGMAVGEQLLRIGRIDRDQLERAVVHAERLGERLEDALVLTGAIDEQGLLEFLASLYRTQFVTRNKLARARGDVTALRMVPKKSARTLGCVPLKYDVPKRTLIVAAADPVDIDVATQVRVVARVPHVKVVVALPSAIEAAIRKFYDGDRRAFERLEEESGLISLDALGVDTTGAGGGSSGDAPSWVAPPAEDDAFDPFDAPLAAAPPGAQAGGARPRVPVPLPGIHPRGGLPEPPRFGYGPPPAGSASEGPGAIAPQGPSWKAHLETVEALVTLLERERGGLRGHSAHVGRLARKVCERLDLDARETDAIVLAGLLHDIGKTGSNYHLTALNVAEYEGHRIQAEKACETVLRLFEGADLPEPTRLALRHMYERVDGQGFPSRLLDKDVPRGARILAMVDTYSDLTRHDKNPFRCVMAPREACDALERHAERLFDRGVLGALRKVVLGDEVRERLLADRRRLLLVESDREEALALELRVVEHGFDVTLARELTEARRRFESGGFDVVVVASGGEVSPLGVLKFVRQVHGAGVPVVVLGERGEQDLVEKAFGAGADDFLVKPVAGDVVAAKLRRLVTRPAQGRGIRGSLREMSLVDVLQVLTHGRKSGRLVVRSPNGQGELQLREGAIYDARFGAYEGEAAVYAMVRLEDGEFSLDASFVPTARRIHASTESLLLEGMRRMDEGLAVDAAGEASPG